MGTWGIAIASNDTYLDTYSEYFSKYNKGSDPYDISAYLINSNQDIISESDSADCHSFWFALAMAQWETKSLSPVVLSKVKAIIQSGNDLQQWKQLGASKMDLDKRQRILNNFLIEISGERERPKPRTKTRPPLFQKGDCVTFKLQNGNYGGVVILESYTNEENEVSSNLAAATRINMLNEPAISDFINAEVLITNFQFDNDKQANQEIDWLFQYGTKKVKELTKIVGKIDIVYRFSPAKNYGSSSRLDTWFEKIIDDVPKQYKSEETKPRHEATKTIKELTQSEEWRYW